VVKHPQHKTPAVAERLDLLRKEFREQLESFGLTPEGRRGLGLPQSAVSFGAQNRNRPDPVLAYRRPVDHEAFVRRLVALGIWQAVGQQLTNETNGATNEQTPSKEANDPRSGRAHEHAARSRRHGTAAGRDAAPAGTR
jgi:hypothetical protein